MQRSEVIQRLLDLYEAPSYLEIGVCDGTTFHAVRAARRVAVDPAFTFDPEVARADPAQAGATYHPIPSDAYFTGAGRDDAFDLIFLDGLHLFDQTLRDLIHAIARLKPGGAIVIDDVLPVSYGASLRDVEESAKFRRMSPGPEEAKAWMGDVFKLVFWIRDYLLDWDYATVDANHGQLVLWRGPRAQDVPPLDIEAIARLEYKDVVFRPRAYNFRTMDAIVQAVKSAAGRS
jgi:SAM-dependent methyltransferase